MTQASTKAFADLKESDKLSKQESEIVNCFKELGNGTIRAIRTITYLKESTICARISGLREKGYVKEAGKSGKYTLWQYVSDPDERKQVAYEYRRKRFIATAERMLNEYGEFMSDLTRRQLQWDVRFAKEEQSTPQKCNHEFELQRYARPDKSQGLKRICKHCGIEPHKDNDFSYVCGSHYCRCIQ